MLVLPTSDEQMSRSLAEAAESQPPSVFSVSRSQSARECRTGTFRVPTIGDSKYFHSPVNIFTEMCHFLLIFLIDDCDKLGIKLISHQ